MSLPRRVWHAGAMASRAGTVAQPQDLVDLTALLDAYYDVSPDLGDPGQRVAFGTSGHRGSSLKASFNEPHIVAITQAIVEYRAGQGITGPLFLAKDTHALSEPAQNSALEVLAANGVNVLIDARHGYTPTPSLSHAILTHNNNSPAGRPAGGRHRGHAQPQPARRRRLQVQPAARRTRRLGRHRLDRQPGQRTAGKRPPRGQADPHRGRPQPPAPRASSTSSAATWTTSPPSWT